MKTAVLFPGQGAQFIGMGKDLYDNFLEAKEAFQEVDEVLKQKLSDLIFYGEIEELTLTANTQPALMVVSYACFKALAKQGNLKLEDISSFAAGHSLGEYSAYAVAGSLSLSETAKLLRIRGEAMQLSSLHQRGAMVALLGGTVEDVEVICKQAQRLGVCDIANDNGAEQIVVSGELAAIDYIVANYRDFSIKRAIKLSVSAAFHSELMKSAAEKMQLALNGANLKLPIVPVISNIDVESYDDVDAIKDSLYRQVCGRVRWRQTMEYFAQVGVTQYIEIGAGRVLSNIAKKMQPESKIYNISNLNELDVYLSGK